MARKPEQLDHLRTMTLDKAAELLAVSKRTLHRLIAAKQFPQPVKVGASSRIRVVDLERYLNGRRGGH